MENDGFCVMESKCVPLDFLNESQPRLRHSLCHRLGPTTTSTSSIIKYLKRRVIKVVMKMLTKECAVYDELAMKLRVSHRNAMQRCRT